MCAHSSCSCVHVSLFTCGCPRMSYCENKQTKKLLWNLCRDLWTSISAADGQEGLEFLLISDGQTQGSLHLKHHCFCQGPRVQSKWAEQLWSAVLCYLFIFFPPLNHTGEHVCVWDAGMHGANPPLSSNAWTVSKTLLLLLFLSMLIRRGLGVGVRWVHRCNSRLTSQDS